MGWPEEEARRKALLSARAPKLWADLKDALRRDVDEFMTHLPHRAAVTFRQPQMENSIWMDVQRVVDPLVTGKSVVNVSFNPEKRIVEVAINNPPRHLQFRIELGGDGEIGFAQGDGTRLTVDQVSEQITRPVLSPK